MIYYTDLRSRVLPLTSHQQPFSQAPLESSEQVIHCFEHSFSHISRTICVITWATRMNYHCWYGKYSRGRRVGEPWLGLKWPRGHQDRELWLPENIPTSFSFVTMIFERIKSGGKAKGNRNEPRRTQIWQFHAVLTSRMEQTGIFIRLPHPRWWALSPPWSSVPAPKGHGCRCPASLAGTRLWECFPCGCDRGGWRKLGSHGTRRIKTQPNSTGIRWASLLEHIPQMLGL